MTDRTVAIILPALNEEGAVGSVVRGFTRKSARVVVVDNGSHDATAARARAAGAEVVTEPVRGYGAACRAGLAYLAQDPPDVVAFADCDGSVDPADLDAVVGPIRAGDADLVLGRRARMHEGAMPTHQRLGNGLVLIVFQLLYGRRFDDIPPLRALTWPLAARLQLRHPTYGFPVETLARACRADARIFQVPVTYRRRTHGTSKVSGSWTTSLKAGAVMVAALSRIRFGGDLL